jgi:Rrf2 family protein
MALRAGEDMPLLSMRLPARTDYAIRAAAELAGLAPGGWMKGRDVARSQRIPYKFLMGILRQLTLSGIVESRRGSEGGFRPARPAQAVSLAEVVCAAGTHRSMSDPAASVVGSAVTRVWSRLEREVERVLSAIPLSDVAAADQPASGTPASWA